MYRAKRILAAIGSDAVVEPLTSKDWMDEAYNEISARTKNVG